MLTSISRALVVLAMLVSTTGILRAEEEVKPDAELRETLLFTHPQVTRSPSPDTKLRLDYELTKQTDGGDAKIHTIRMVGEFAPLRWLSFEADLPYTFADRDEAQNRHNLDDMQVGFKLASFALEDSGVLFGGGLDIVAPTGNSENAIGSDRLVVIEPFLDAGLKRGRIEGVGSLGFAIPANDNSSDPDWGITANLSFLVHFSYMMAGLVEFDLERAWGSEVDNETIVNMSPGFRWNPSDDPNLWFGTNLSFPLTNDDAFDLRWQLSGFYHF